MNADCFDVFPFIEDKSIDAIICDLPYGTTQNKWDSTLPLNLIWEQYKRIIKDNGAIILFAQTPFDKVLGASNLPMLKYEWIWRKSRPTGHLNANKMPMKAVIYVRVSKASKFTNGQSIDNQEELCLQYCRLKGLEVVDVLTDDGLSGYKTNRPGFVRVMDMVRNKEVGAVVVYSLSRFARNTSLTIEAIDLMKKKGVVFHSLTDSIDTGSAAGKLFLTMLAGYAEFERSVTGERTKSVLDRKRENGEALGSIPYGYRKEDKMLVEDEYEQYVIKAILKWHDEEKGYGEIQRLCECNELRSRSGKWHRQTIKNIVEANLVR